MFQHAPVLAALVSAAVLYLFWLVGAFVVALMIAAVAPRFGGENNRIQAMKVAAYAFTPSMLSGVFAIFPPLAVLGVLGFYSFYLLWAGLPKLMKVSEERRLGFYAVVLVLMLAIGMLSGFLIAPLMAVDRLTPR